MSQRFGLGELYFAGTSVLEMEVKDTGVMMGGDIITYYVASGKFYCI